MFLRHARTARFVAAYLLFFTASLVLMVPKVNDPGTPFNETTTSTNEIVIQTDGASTDTQRVDTEIRMPKIFEQPGMINVRGVFAAYAGQSADFHGFQELFSPLLC